VLAKLHAVTHSHAGAWEQGGKYQSGFPVKLGNEEGMNAVDTSLRWYDIRKNDLIGRF